MADSGKRGRPRHSDILTPAEWRIVDAIRHGMSGPEIAKRRAISLDAVKFHVANILSKLGLDRRSELKTWTGIRNDSALHAQETRMESLLMGPVGQISRTVSDIAAARHWYGEVLGLEHLFSFGDIAFFDCGGIRLFLTEESDGPEGESVVYFRVEDIRLTHTALESAGVEFVNAPHLIHRHDDGTEEWMAFFKDNEGRTLAIMSQVKASVS
ncbi:VOC family protein [uncultured Caulobacter sp.]|uniref:VOC family protein n=1 Tax=uncultured Caulobacter sp. TaxID=158749 RepID=UPI00261CB64E|nr:VOC family protein [uncultured Caulobacter sp.]